MTHWIMPTRPTLIIEGRVLPHRVIWLGQQAGTKMKP